MNCYWYKGNWTDTKGNVGDMVSPIIVNHLAGYPPSRAHKDDKGKLLAVGSVISFLREGDFVWGSGVIKPVKIPFYENVTFKMLRGKLTREWLIKSGYDVPKVYGEPCFLLPWIIKRHDNKKRKIGIVAHYAEKAEAMKMYPDSYFIDVLTTPEKFVSEICECEKILSSSLHGIVIAEAYGIHAGWFQITKKIIGGDFKFFDYYSESGRTPVKCKYMPLPEVDIDVIIKSFPYELCTLR